MKVVFCEELPSLPPLPEARVRRECGGGTGWKGGSGRKGGHLKRVEA